MPNLDNIRLWHDALSSGEYRQGIGSLHDIDKNTWCCLGVACDVARKNGVELAIMPHSDDDAEEYFDGEQAFLPDKVAAWLGLDNCNPLLVSPDGDRMSATEWNDGKMLAFPEIAGLVKNTYLSDSEHEEREDDSI